MDVRNLSVEDALYHGQRLQYVDEAKLKHCRHFRGTVDPLSVYCSGTDTAYEGQRRQSVDSPLLPGWQTVALSRRGHNWWRRSFDACMKREQSGANRSGEPVNAEHDL